MGRYYKQQLPLFQVWFQPIATSSLCSYVKWGWNIDAKKELQPWLEQMWHVCQMTYFCPYYELKLYDGDWGVLWMIHGGGGAKWVERENKGYMEINVYVYLFVLCCVYYVDNSE